MGRETPRMPNKPTEIDKREWEYKIGDLRKTEWVLTRILRNLFTVLTALCDTKVKKQIKLFLNSRYEQETRLYGLLKVSIKCVHRKE